MKADVVAITGSVGKTSVKDLAQSILSRARNVTASPRSYNAELGLALTLVNAPSTTDVMVLEMGARGPGQIAELCRIASPRIGVVTSVAASHLEGFGSIETIRATKAELVESLPADGHCVLNLDDENVARMRSGTKAATVMYSAGGDLSADIRATDVSMDDKLKTTFQLDTPWGSGQIVLGLHGIHNVENALGAAGAALVTGASFADVVGALQNARPSPNRMDLLERPDGVRIINDTYNANPKSTEAALRALARIPAKRRIAVLGVMAELGADSAELHRRVADLSMDLGILLIAIDTDEYEVAPVANHDAALAALEKYGLGEGDVVLVKGSRVAQLDRLVAMLVER
jgi:UDP-N-acetylmuramoyl-tripeptide--D-alanyl-D-alanine ligase